MRFYVTFNSEFFIQCTFEHIPPFTSLLTHFLMELTDRLIQMVLNIQFLKGLLTVMCVSILPFCICVYKCITTCMPGAADSQMRCWFSQKPQLMAMFVHVVLGI